MTHSELDSRVALLTAEDVGARLNLTLPAVDHLVATGELKPVPASRHGRHLFWPDDVMAYDLWESKNAGSPAPVPGPVERTNDLVGGRPAGAADSDRTAGMLPRRGRRKNRPAWPPFTGPRERGAAYLAFADGDHLISYLRSRKLEAVEDDLRERPGRMPVKVR
jgi:hypothetical protein